MIHRDVTIDVRNVCKTFLFQHQKTLKEVLQALFIRQKTLERIETLRNVSFSIYKGETVGILGRNGAGKSTLLKLIAHVSTPTSGTVVVNGRLVPLIELGAGFHPELSGMENIYLNGIILGLSEQQVRERVQSIIEFSELRQFVDMPVKHYSSGMFMRLAFSIAVSVEPDILLVDEVLSVGDLNFQEKCIRRMHEFRKQGVTTVLVSHNPELVQSFCERVIVLSEGCVLYDGATDQGLQVYKEQL